MQELLESGYPTYVMSCSIPGVLNFSQELGTEAVSKHMVAVSTNLKGTVFNENYKILTRMGSGQRVRDGSKELICVLGLGWWSLFCHQRCGFASSVTSVRFRYCSVISQRGSINRPALFALPSSTKYSDRFRSKFHIMLISVHDCV